MLLASAAGAKPVDEDLARRVASSVLGGAEVKNLSSELSFSELYLFVRTYGDGFVVVSADDCALPVVAYSRTSQFSTAVKPAMDWLAACAGQITDMRRQGIEASDYVAGQWDEAAGYGLKDGSDAIGPLLTTTWNQSPYENTLCPYDNGAHANTLAGCGAIAMAQVMKYWNHPATGYGYHEYTLSGYGTLSADFGGTAYQWASMPNELTAASTSTEVEAVATLVYHAGVALEMQYSPYNSWSYLFYNGYYGPCVEYALPNYFGYSSDVHVLDKREYKLAEWRALLLSELTARRPVIYRGADINDDGGHIFVCDGYDGSGSFHFNWGWGGYADGYFTVGSLNPDSYNDFSYGNYAVVGIHPASAAGTTVAINAVPNNPDWGSVSGSGTSPFLGRVATLEAMAWNGYRFGHWSDGCIDNPRYRPFCEDVNDTAVFVPVSRDTVSFSHDRIWGTFNLGIGNDVLWGIRIDRELLSQGKRLKAVLFYLTGDCDGELQIFNHGGLGPDSLIHRQPFTYRDIGGWVTIWLDSLVSYDATQPLWVVMRTPDTYMVPYSRYAGVPDGTWCRNANNRWSTIYRSMLLHAIFEPAVSGIAAAGASEAALSVVSEGRTLKVGTSAAGDPIMVYDVRGRLLGSGIGSLVLQVPSAGVYVAVSGSAIRKILMF